MNRLQLFRILRRHVGLSEKRSLAFEQNRVAKFVAYLLGSFMVVYMMMISVTLAMVANDLSEFTSYEFIYALLPFTACKALYVAAYAKVCMRRVLRTDKYGIVEQSVVAAYNRSLCHNDHAFQ